MHALNPLKGRCCFNSCCTHEDTEAHKISNMGKQSWGQTARNFQRLPFFFTIRLGVEPRTLSSGGRGSTAEFQPSLELSLRDRRERHPQAALGM